MDAGSSSAPNGHLPALQGEFYAGPNSPLQKMTSQPDSTQEPEKPKDGDSGTGTCRVDIQLQGGSSP